MLQQTLKEATKNKHAALEELMFVKEIMNGTLSVYQYTQIISTLYLVYQQFENKLHSLIDAENTYTLRLEKRKKTSLLKNDLLEVNAVPGFIVDTYPINFEQEAAALGALYVLEGATLGGNIIVKHLKTNPQFISLDLHFHYYQAYGDKVFVFWKKFCETLNKQPLHLYSQIIDGAVLMFEYLIFIQKKMMHNS